MIQAATSTEYVQYPTSATINGVSHDPTADPVSFAFTATGEPASGDWHNGVWSQPVTGQFFAQCLVGPGTGGVPLPVGEYLVWVRITDNPEVPERPVGRLTIY